MKIEVNKLFRKRCLLKSIKINTLHLFLYFYHFKTIFNKPIERTVKTEINICLLIYVLLLSQNLFAQQAASLIDFFEQVEQKKSSYIEISSKPREMQWSNSFYYEVFWAPDGEVYFLANALWPKGREKKTICQCAEETFMEYLQKQKTSFRNRRDGRFSFDMRTLEKLLGKDKCIIEIGFKSFNGEYPVLKSLLWDEVSDVKVHHAKFTQVPSDVSVTLLKDTLGALIVEIEGTLPKGLTLYDFEITSELDFVKGRGNHWCFPPQETVDWKRKLMASGFFSGRLSSALVDEEKHLEYTRLKENVDWTFITAIKCKYEKANLPIRIKGTLLCNATTEKVNVSKVDLTPMEDGEISLYCDGKRLRFTSGIHVDRKRTAWMKQVILNQENDTLAVFEQGKKSKIFEYQPKIGEQLFREITAYELVKVAIPFEEDIEGIEDK